MKEHLQAIFKDQTHSMIDLFQLLKVEIDADSTATVYELILDKAPEGGFQSQAELIEAINEVCQKYLLRRPGSERWDLNDSAFLKDNHQQIFEVLRQLGFIEELKAPIDSYEHACLLGSLEPTVKLRREHLEQALKSKDILHVSHYYLLGGQRDLRSEDEPLAQKAGINTELDMMVEDWQTRGKIQEKAIPVDAPKRADGSRPNTQDTIEYFMKIPHVADEIQREGKLKPVLVCSNQPYARRQALVFEGILPPGTTIHVIGNAAPKDILLSKVLDEVARYIYQTKHNLTLKKKLNDSEDRAIGPALVNEFGLAKKESPSLRELAGNSAQPMGELSQSNAQEKESPKL